jgi:pyruvate dehydrogenase E1 component
VSSNHSVNDSQLQPYLVTLLSNSSGPIIAATDYVRALPDSVRAYVPQDRSFESLGTDGFGRSDTRATLRQFFHVDAASVAHAAKVALKLA